MLHSTEGIILHTTNYADNSVIIKVYTKNFGLCSFMAKGIRGKKSKNKANILQPLACVDMVVYYKEKNNLQRVNEIKLNEPFLSIPYDIIKSSIALFIDEIIYRSVKEEEANPVLFSFLQNAVRALDVTSHNCANFHLVFLIRLSKHLGFFPQGNYAANSTYFDLQEGLFVENKPIHPYFITPPLSNLFYQLLMLNFENTHTIKYTAEERKELLEKLVTYYELHTGNMQQIKSHRVLEEVLSS